MELLKLIDLVHAAAVDMQAWPAALTAIADALGARASSLSIIDPENTAAPFVCAPRTDPLWLRAYHDRWAASNLVRDRGYALPPGELYDFESLGMPRSEFDRTAYYNEFWAPQHLNFGLIMLAAKEETAVSAIGFYRSTASGRFAADDERLLRELAPHLRRAVSLNLLLARFDTQRSLTVSVLNHVDRGALLVDEQARILFANTAAEAALGEGGGLRVSGGRLATRIATKTAALQATIASGMNGTLALTGAAGTRLTVEIVALGAETWRLPQRPAAIVFIEPARRNIMPSQEQIARLFDLTPAQAALARELLHGDGIPAAAMRLGISRSTARTHLLKLFEKTGTNRQAELVRLILQQESASVAPDPEPPASHRNGKPRAKWRDIVSGALAAIVIGRELFDALLAL